MGHCCLEAAEGMTPTIASFAVGLQLPQSKERKTPPESPEPRACTYGWRLRRSSFSPGLSAVGGDTDAESAGCQHGKSFAPPPFMQMKGKACLVSRCWGTPG